MQVSEINDFTGGISNVYAAHKILPNEARTLTNVDINSGALKSIPMLYHISEVEDTHFFEYQNRLIWYKEWRSNALLNNILYWSTDGQTGKVLQDLTELPIGIPEPTNELTTTVEGDPDSGSLDGNLKYCYTFYNNNTGTESAPSNLSPTITADGQNVRITGFEDLPEHATHYRLYRVGGYLARFTLVTELGSGTTEYLDSLTEKDVDGRLLETLNNGIPPAGISNFVEWGGRLWGSAGSRVYYSAAGNGDSWYVYDFFDVQTDVVALAKTPSGVLVLGHRFTSIIEGVNPTNFRIRTISNHMGCVSNKSVAYIASAPIWLGENGIYMFTDRVINLTTKRIRRIRNIEPGSAVVHDDCYYMSFRPMLVPSEELYPREDLYPGSIADGTGDDLIGDGIIVLDFKYGNGFSYSVKEYENAVSLGIYRDAVYFVSSYRTSNVDCESIVDCTNHFCTKTYHFSRINLEYGNRYKMVRYLSPKYIDGSYATLKEYDKVRINFIGSFKVQVIFDDNKVVVEKEIKSDNLLTFASTSLLDLEDEIAIIGIPNNDNKSTSIAFSIVGVGIIKAIQWSWQPRTLP